MRFNIIFWILIGLFPILFLASPVQASLSDYSVTTLTNGVGHLPSCGPVIPCIYPATEFDTPNITSTANNLGLLYVIEENSAGDASHNNGQVTISDSNSNRIWELVSRTPTSHEVNGLVHYLSIWRTMTTVDTTGFVKITTAQTDGTATTQQAVEYWVDEFTGL